MLNRLTRIQLSMFAAITVLSVTAMALFYLHLPATFGIGVYRVTAAFATGGGIYNSANVTYRGVTIGRVESVDYGGGGVIAKIRLNADTPVPANVTATVKSLSAVGEQYIDLVPPQQPSKTLLHNGATITRDHTVTGQDIAELLQQAEALINNVADSRLQDLLRETFKAFNGSGPELSRLIHSSRQLVDEANASHGQTTALIGQAGPILDAQIRSGDEIKAFAARLAQLTTEIRQADPHLKAVLHNAPDAADAANTTFSGIRPSFPILAANMANAGRIGVIYHKSIEQVLVVMPALFAALLTVAGGEPLDEGGKLDFKIDIGDPPPCITGFLPAPLVRTPADETIRDVPADMYCKVAQNDPSAVRGARNYPCMEYPGKRAPTIELCRDPKGYVPIGSNPWRGPPVPYGTPVTDPRMTLPMNKFPFIPPQADYDPGPPVLQLPPGVSAGPAPAPNPPFPLPVPPADGSPPLPLPYQGPTVPPYGVAPPDTPTPGEAPSPTRGQTQANGASYATYDRNGVFIDPAGSIGTYAPGAGQKKVAENWLDLMLDPRPPS